MPRHPGERTPADDRHNERRRKGPRPGSYVLIPLSISNAPLTANLYRDDHMLARLIRLDVLASAMGAVHKNDVLTMTLEDVRAAMCCQRTEPAKIALRSIADALRWPLRWSPDGRTVQVEIRKFGKMQGLTPRKERGETRGYAGSPSPSPSSSLRSEEIAATRLTPFALTSPENGEPETTPEATPEVDAEAVLEAWRRICVPRGAPDVREMTTKRVAKLRSRLREHPEHAWWSDLFEAMAGQSFLFGNNGRGWRIDFDWLIENDTNAVKILEGRYGEKETAASTKH